MRKPQMITISGAGSCRTPALIGTLMQMKERFPVSRIIFMDKDLSRFHKIEDYCRLLLKTYSPQTEIIVTDDLDQAYSHCDFVFCQMRVGQSHMRSLDEKIPLKYGLVGQETCGPGGFAYGMRSIGGMKEMVDCVRRHSDQTWILNYTNPAAIVGLALDRLYPEDQRIINMCDQPYSMMVSFAKILNVDPKKLRARYFGLNHFGWFTDLYDTQGNQYFDQLRDYLKNHDFRPYNAEQRTKSWLDTYLRVNRMLNCVPEYIPTTYLQYYFYSEEIVRESDPHFTRADETMQTREKEVWDLCAKAAGREELGDLPVLTSPVFGSMMVEVAESIAYDLNQEFIVMTRNRGLIDNFPSDAVVEVAGTLGSQGVKGIPYGSIKPFYKGLMENQYAYEELTCQAWMERDYTKALQALALNRTVNDFDKARAVLDDLMEANKEYWTLEKRDGSCI